MMASCASVLFCMACRCQLQNGRVRLCLRVVSWWHTRTACCRPSHRVAVQELAPASAGPGRSRQGFRARAAFRRASPALAAPAVVAVAPSRRLTPPQSLQARPPVLAHTLPKGITDRGHLLKQMQALSFEGPPLKPACGDRCRHVSRTERAGEYVPVDPAFITLTVDG